MQALLNASIELPTKFGRRRHGHANTPGTFSINAAATRPEQVGCARDLSGDALLAGKRSRGALGAPTFEHVGARPAGSGSIEQYRKIEDFIRPVFQQYYTMSFDNYPVEMERIEHPNVHPCK